MKKIISIGLLCLIIQTNAFGQNYLYDINYLKTSPDTSFRVFASSENPSFLVYDIDDERLKITTIYNSQQNGIKRFFVPSRSTLYQIQFSGKKKIGENQIFKGIFGFNKLIRKDWTWVFSKNFETGNPFLLGDSSKGSSVFNGIFFDAMYSNQVSENLLLGAALEYFVDEGLKQVSPRPTSQHRDLKFKFGFNYEVMKKLKAGISFQVKDEKEEISYKEDEGAVYKEITLFKFRGLNFPVAIKKKTETRNSFVNGYDLIGDLIYEPNEQIKFLGDIKKGIEQIFQRDEVTNPQNQGKFQNDYLKIKLLSFIKPIKKFSSLIGFNYFNSRSWSRHPDYFSVMSDGVQNFISLQGSVRYDFSSKVFLSSGIGYGKFKLDINDYYSDVYYKLNSLLYSLNLTLQLNLLEHLSIRFFLAQEKYKPSKSELSFTTGYIYFQNFFKDDLDYFSTEFVKYETTLSIKFNTTIGEFELNLNYNFCKPIQSLSRNYLSNSSLQSSLNYYIEVN